MLGMGKFVEFSRLAGSIESKLSNVSRRLGCGRRFQVWAALESIFLSSAESSVGSVAVHEDLEGIDAEFKADAGVVPNLT